MSQVPHSKKSPRISPEDQKAIQTYWVVYEAHMVEIQDELAHLAEFPEYARFVQSTTPEQLIERQRTSRENQHKAIFEGDWGPYLGYLHQMGAAYANAGLTFSAWFGIIGPIRKLMLPLLIEAYKTDQERLLEAIKGMGFFIDLAMGEIGDAYLETKQDIIRHQQDAIRELSTPVLQLRDGLLILPLIGVLDSFRANQVTQHLLHAIRDRRARVVVIDITGVPTVDSAVANHLIQTVDASRLMGTETIITGLSADIAQTLVRLGVDLTKLNTKGDLQHGVDTALRLIHYKTVRIREEPATYDPMDEGNE